MISRTSDNKQVKEIIKKSGQPSILMNKRYRVGVISDRHLGYNYGVSNFAKCLQNLKNYNCDFIVNCGDMTASGTDTEYGYYIDTINASPYTRADIHECMGNHEYYSGEGAAAAKEKFKTYSNNGELANATNIYFYKDINGDRFIFTWLETLSYDGDNCITATQLAFIQNAITSYTGNGFIWVITHQDFQWRGAGDWPEDPYYNGGMKTGSSYPKNTAFFNLLNSHQNIIHVHGHSHFSYRYYNTDLGVAVSKGYNGKLCVVSRAGNSGLNTRRAGCIGIHIPSGTRLKWANSSTANPTEHYMDGESESLVVDVYENGLRLIGVKDGTGAIMFTHDVLINGDIEVARIAKIVDGVEKVVFNWT